MIPVAIRHKIEARYGKPVRYSKDCDGLANSINKFCLERVSVTTLKRLFGFAKSVEQHRFYTLDVIAEYIGYKDWSNLMASVQKMDDVITQATSKEKALGNSFTEIHFLYHQISMSLTTDTINLKNVVSLCRDLGGHKEIFPFIIEMIGLAARQKNVQFLKEVFNMPVIFDEQIHNPIKFYYVGQAMGLMMRNNPDIADELIAPLAANKKAQHYFIEWFVDEDYLQGYYGRLIDAYHHNRKTTVSDKLFYYALKHNQSNQSGDVVARLNWYKKVKGLKIPPTLYAILAARYAGICLSNEPAHLFSPSSPYFKLIRKYIMVKNTDEAIGFTFFLCRELFKSRRTDWLVQAVNELEKHKGDPLEKAKSHLTVKVQNGLLIYRSFASLIAGNKRKASQLFRQVDPNLFDSFIYQQMHEDYIYVAEKLREK